MRKTRSIKEALLQVAVITTALLMASCSNTQKPEDSKDVSEEHNEAKFDNKQENDAQFLVNAAEINLEEIQLGQLAQQKAGTTHVRELGKRMEDAHTKSLNDLRALAKSKMITLPTSPTNNTLKAYKKLNKESGNDFDKAYADKMVSVHKDAITAFEEASTDCNDEDIKNWAKTTLPSLHTHLDHSIDCQNKLDKI